nr:reverse transcriptase domain-containing protein [Tanacetum cinerariifolium]
MSESPEPRRDHSESPKKRGPKRKTVFKRLEKGVIYMLRDKGKKLKQNNEKDQAKAAKKGETPGKEKPLAILMVQPWKRVAKQKITQTFSPESIISFLPLGEEDRTEGPMIIEAKMGGHFVHRMYVDGGRPGVRRIQVVPSTAHEKLKFAVAGEAVTLRSSRIIPLECTVVLGPGVQQPVVDKVTEEKIQDVYPLDKRKGGRNLREKGNLRRSRKVGRHWHHERSPLLQLAIKPSNGAEA